YVAQLSRLIPRRLEPQIEPARLDPPETLHAHETSSAWPIENALPSQRNCHEYRPLPARVVFARCRQGAVHSYFLGARNYCRAGGEREWVYGGWRARLGPCESQAPEGPWLNRESTPQYGERLRQECVQIF